MDHHVLSTHLDFSITISFVKTSKESLQEVLKAGLLSTFDGAARRPGNVTESLSDEETSTSRQKVGLRKSQSFLSIVGISFPQMIERDKLHTFKILKHAIASNSRDGQDRCFVSSPYNIRSNELATMGMLAHLVAPEDEKPKTPVAISTSQKELLATSETMDSARGVLLLALRQKISTYIVIKPELIEDSTPLEDFGLDSLVRIEFRDWILRTFSAKLEGREISNAGSIVELAAMILERTNLLGHLKSEPNVSVAGHSQTGCEPELDRDERNSANDDRGIPRQPLMPLDKTLTEFFSTCRTFCSVGELTQLRSALEIFKSPSGVGPILHGRLAEKAQDPNVHSWLSEFYTERRFLMLRTPLVIGQTYFGTHLLGSITHTQAQRAAIVSLAALDFKHRCESGAHKPHLVGGMPVDPSSYQFLFNTNREPCVGVDKLLQRSRNNDIVVFRRGRAHRLCFDETRETVKFGSLQKAFETIIQETMEEVHWVGHLTADERNSWSKVEQSLADLDILS